MALFSRIKSQLVDRNRPAVRNPSIVIAVLLMATLALSAIAYALDFAGLHSSRTRLNAKSSRPFETSTASEVPTRSSVTQQQTSSQFDLSNNVIAGGGGASTAVNFNVEGTLGQNVFDTQMNGGQFAVSGGFWQSDSASTPTPTPTPTPSPTPPATAVQFSAATFNVNEAGLSATVTIMRTGDTTVTSSVDYATSDASGANLCAVTNGAASARCDYITSLGRLTFAPNEVSKNISVLIIDDVYAEGIETLGITLSNPTGAVLGPPSLASITINDNDAVNGTNPIDTASFFVRQHYLDFLNREPDASGLAFWTDEITSCGAGAQCIEVKRINVSAAFFLSIEFQETGYLVYRIYKSGFGNLPGAPVPIRFIDFLKDTQQIGQGVVVGATNWEALLEANKQAYAIAFVQRTDFQAAFPDSLTAQQFVDQLDTNAGGVLSAAERTTLLGLLGATPSDLSKRASVLRSVAEDATLRDTEFNNAFVLMQYFGYMRRNPNDAPDPDFGGFNFWLGKLNQFHGNFVQAEMVKAFITSIECRQRFGP